MLRMVLNDSEIRHKKFFGDQTDLRDIAKTQGGDNALQFVLLQSKFGKVNRGYRKTRCTSVGCQERSMNGWENFFFVADIRSDLVPSHGEGSMNVQPS